MTDYTPTTEEIRNRYLSEVFPEDEAEFDRWLAEHDRQVAEKAWGQGAAANIVSTVMNGPSRGIPRNLYRQGEEQ